MSGAPEPIILPAPHPATLEEEELLSACVIGKGRASGPGGQNRNKVETLVIITHEPSGVESHAGERRSAAENRSVALRRLRLALAVRVRTAVPLGEIRSELWMARCQGGRIVCSTAHRDYPSLLAQALDVVCGAGFDVRKAALRLCVSTTQLVRFVQEHPPAMVMVNEGRAARGMRPLK